MKQSGYIFILLLILQVINIKSNCNCDDRSFYFRVEGGKSFSRKADIKVDETVFDPAQEGYNSKLKSAVLLTAGVGYNITNWLSIGFSAAHRNKYKYKKHQTVIPTEGVPNPFGNKTRFFKLDNNSFLFDIYFNRTGASTCWSFGCDSVNVAPYFGVSIGLSKNKLYDFHTVLDDTLTSGNFTTHAVETVESLFVKHSFAWQISVGLDLTICKNITLGIGYRYFDGGKFRSNDYTVNPISSFENNPIEVPQWCGKLRANEVVASFAINF